MTSESAGMAVSMTETCPDCGGMHFSTDYDRGERYCTRCGCILEEMFIDMRPEPTYEGKDRVHTSPVDKLRHDKGLSTGISMIGRDCNGKPLNPKDRYKFQRLKTIQRNVRISNAVDRGLAAAFTEIKKMCASLSLPDNICEDSAMLYKKGMKKGLVRGRSIRLISAACIYISCRTHNVPRTLKEISSESRIGSTDLGRAYRFVARSLRLKLMFTRPQDYISRFCSELKLSAKCQKNAMDLLEEFEREGLTSGKGPMGIAAAAIYLSSQMCNERRTQKDISRVSCVTEVTLRNRSNEMIERLHIPYHG